MNKVGLNESTNYQKRPLVRKLYIFIINLISFLSNEKSKTIVKFTILCATPLMIWNHIPIEFACILFFALLIVVNLEMKENEIFGRINEKVMKYRYGECEKVYNGQKMYLLSILLAIAYFVIFILNFSFNEALGLLIALPYAVYVVTCILIVTIDLIFIQGTMKKDVIYKSEIYLGYKIEEIHLKNIYKQVTYKSFLYPKNSSGSGIKHYIEDEFGKHDADGWTIQQNDTSDSKY